MVAASFTQRAIGRCIDIALLGLLISIAAMPFADGDELDDVDVPALFQGAVVLGTLAYEIVPVFARGQTAGKVLTRTRIVTADGGPVSMRSAFLRWAPVCALWILLAALGLPSLAVVAIAALYLSALADPGGRNLLDKLAGTRVVRSNAPVPDEAGDAGADAGTA